ncbi:hypothetical protein BLNAU_17457 [Blattamonas nauphoetae]|uniref:Transmembrane protein n=1 Tax=Blattamonas nauphoetae TaxID=2049346 RepID=A0ABQ9X7E0_9EUKA|nr:hypothetical protein BLNAU_17457 [Blattamonas nauphoetae]
MQHCSLLVTTEKPITGCVFYIQGGLVLNSFTLPPSMTFGAVNATARHFAILLHSVYANYVETTNCSFAHFSTAANVSSALAIRSTLQDQCFVNIDTCRFHNITSAWTGSMQFTCNGGNVLIRRCVFSLCYSGLASSYAPEGGTVSFKVNVLSSITIAQTTFYGCSATSGCATDIYLNSATAPMMDWTRIDLETSSPISTVLEIASPHQTEFLVSVTPSFVLSADAPSTALCSTTTPCSSLDRLLTAPSFLSSINSMILMNSSTTFTQSSSYRHSSSLHMAGLVEGVVIAGPVISTLTNTEIPTLHVINGTSVTFSTFSSETGQTRFCHVLSDGFATINRVVFLSPPDTILKESVPTLIRSEGQIILSLCTFQGSNYSSPIIHVSNPTSLQPTLTHETEIGGCVFEDSTLAHSCVLVAVNETSESVEMMRNSFTNLTSNHSIVILSVKDSRVVLRDSSFVECCVQWGSSLFILAESNAQTRIEITNMKWVNVTSIEVMPLTRWNRTGEIDLDDPTTFPNAAPFFFKTLDWILNNTAIPFTTYPRLPQPKFGNISSTSNISHFLAQNHSINSTQLMDHPFTLPPTVSIFGMNPPSFPSITLVGLNIERANASFASAIFANSTQFEMSQVSVPMFFGMTNAVFFENCVLTSVDLNGFGEYYEYSSAQARANDGRRDRNGNSKIGRGSKKGWTTHKQTPQDFLKSSIFSSSHPTHTSAAISNTDEERKRLDQLRADLPWTDRELLFTTFHTIVLSNTKARFKNTWLHSNFIGGVRQIGGDVTFETNLPDGTVLQHIFPWRRCAVDCGGNGNLTLIPDQWHLDEKNTTHLEINRASCSVSDLPTPVGNETRTFVEQPILSGEFKAVTTRLVHDVPYIAVYGESFSLIDTTCFLSPLLVGKGTQTLQVKAEVVHEREVRCYLSQEVVTYFGGRVRLEVGNDAVNKSNSIHVVFLHDFDVSAAVDGWMKWMCLIVMIVLGAIAVIEIVVIGIRAFGRKCVANVRVWKANRAIKKERENREKEMRKREEEQRLLDHPQTPNNQNDENDDTMPIHPPNATFQQARLGSVRSTRTAGGRGEDENVEMGGMEGKDDGMQQNDGEDDGTSVRDEIPQFRTTTRQPTAQSRSSTAQARQPTAQTHRSALPTPLPTPITRQATSQTTRTDRPHVQPQQSRQSQRSEPTVPTQQAIVGGGTRQTTARASQVERAPTAQTASGLLRPPVGQLIQTFTHFKKPEMIATPPFVSPFNDEQSPRQDAFQPLQTEDMSNEVSSPRVSISEEQYFSLLKRHLSTLKESRLMMETAHSHRISLLNDQLSTLDTSIAELEREEHDLKEVVSIAKQDEEEDEAFKQKQLERKTELTKAIERNNADIAQIAKLLQQTVSKLNSLKETNSKQDPKPKMPEPEVPSRERTFFTVADVDGTFDEEDSETVQDVPRTKTLASTVSLDERPSYVSLLQKRMGTPLRGGNVTKEREPTLGRRRSVEDAQANPLSSTQKNSTMKPRRSRSPPVTPSTSKIGRRATPEPKTTLKPPEESLLIDVPSALAGTVSDLPQLSNSPTKSVSFVIPSASSLRLFQRSQSKTTATVSTLGYTARIDSSFTTTEDPRKGGAIVSARSGTVETDNQSHIANY